ncbi:MAG: ABC transporter substrate-binding protein [Candidatus Krumholzibacteriia bacterium]
MVRSLLTVGEFCDPFSCAACFMMTPRFRTWHSGRDASAVRVGGCGGERRARAVAWGVLAAALAASGGCTHGGEASLLEQQVQPRRGGTFRMAQDAPASLDPACLDDVYEASIVNQIFDGLLSFDAHLNIMPCIAGSWEISPDGRVYTFQLKRGVRFHDGTEVTSEDVVYSFTRVFDLPPQESALAREYLGHIEGCLDYATRKTASIVGLAAPSPYEVRIQLDRSFGSFLAVLASDPARVVPRHYVERVGPGEFARHPVGSGPFRFADWVEGERVVLTAYEDYHMKRVLLDSLVFELRDENSRDYAAEAFLAGRLSAVLVPDGRLAEFQGRPHTQVLTRQELSLTFIGFDHNHPPFDDRRVRAAFAMAIDRDAMLRNGDMVRIPLNGILPPGMPGYTPESKLLEYDPGRARTLLAEAGYPGGRGLPRIVHTTANQTEESRRLTEEILRQVAAVGFELETETPSWLEFSRRLTAQDIQCFTVTWVADIPDPDSFLYPIGHRHGSANFTGYANPDVDELLLRGRASRNSLERMAVYREAERIILQDAPIVPLFHPLSAIAIQDAVRGVHLTPMGIGDIAMEDIWLLTERQTPEGAE